MSEEVNTFGGFEAINAFLGSDNNTKEDSVGAVKDPIVDPPIDEEETEEVVDASEEPEKTKMTGGFKDERTIEEGVTLEVETTKEEEEVEEGIVEDKDIENITELDEAEPEISAFIQEKIFDKFGWELEEDKKFKSIEEVTDFIKKVVDENSKPEFADDDIAALNKYVNEGGDIKSYYDKVYGGIDVSNVDIERESSQTSIVRESLKLQGYSDERIDKRIERYQDTATLKEEAEDALEYIKGYKKQEAEKLLKEQENMSKTLQEQQQNFFNAVKKDIDKFSDFLGAPVTETERKQLLEYIFKTDYEGKTAYQRDYAKAHKNLVQSAFLTMKGDKLNTKIEKNADSKATLNLKKKLNLKGNRLKGGNNEQEEGGDFNPFATINSIIKPKI